MSKGQLKPLFTPQRCLTATEGFDGISLPNLCRAPVLLPRAGAERKGRGGNQKAQKYSAYLKTWVGAFHYTVVANPVKIIQNI